MKNAEVLSAVLLGLYARAHDTPMEDFQPAALDQVRRHLHFDSAWWAMTTTLDGQSDIHGSYVQNLPKDIAKMWLSIRKDDVIGRAVNARPDTTINFTPDQVDSTNGSRWLASATGFRHVLCTRTFHESIGQSTFLALSRHNDSHGFSEQERQLKQLLMPHLSATLNINRVAQMRQLHALGADRRTAMAVIDRRGAIHNVEPGFTEGLQQEWSAWRGPRLPNELVARMEPGGQVFKGEQISVSLAWMNDVALMHLTPLAPVDRLTPREREVAQIFVAGNSYKEVARQLDMAPATVRHHLRGIYTKLGVSDKAAMAQALWGHAPA